MEAAAVKGVPHAKSKPRQTAALAPEPEIFIEKVSDAADDAEELQRTHERAAHKQRTSTEAAMGIVLSTEALEVPKLAATAIAPKYSTAAGKPLRESTFLVTTLKVVAILSVVVGIGYVATKKSANGMKTPWARLLERKNVLTAEDTSMGEQAPAQQQSAATPITQTDAPPADASPAVATGSTPPATGNAVAAVPSQDSTGLDPQVEAGLIARCGDDLAFCYRTGVTLVDENKFTSASRFFEATCKGGHGLGCAAMGQLFANGSGVTQSYAQAMEYYQKGCELGVGNSCTSLGFGYAKGITGAASPQKAYDAFQKGCAKDVPEACTQAGLAVKNGAGVERAPARAAEYFNKACRMNDSVGCEEARSSKFVN